MWCTAMIWKDRAPLVKVPNSKKCKVGLIYQVPVFLVVVLPGSPYGPVHFLPMLKLLFSMLTSNVIHFHQSMNFLLLLNKLESIKE